MRQFLTMAILLACGIAAGADADSVLAARVSELMVQLADEDNDQRLAPGWDLSQLAVEALPLLVAEQAKKPKHWWVITALDRAVGILTARQAGKPLSAVAERRKIWNDERLSGNYRRGGVRGTWDPQVEEAMEAISRHWSQDPRRAGDERERAIELLDSALAMGCTDPYVAYLAGRMRQDLGMEDSDKIYALMQQAAAGIANTKYYAIDRAFVLYRGAQTIYWSWQGKPAGKQKEIADGWLALVPALLGEAALDPNDAAVSSLLFLAPDYAGFMSSVDSSDHMAAAEPILKAMRAKAPDRAVTALFEATTQRAWAWDARGSGWSNTVTDEGWRLMNERMASCKDFLKHAELLDPGGLYPAYFTLKSANGLDIDRREVGRCLRQAMAADPGVVDPLYAMCEYLEPKWHGSDGELLKFGRHCLALGDWGHDTPGVLLNVHNRLSRYAPEGYGKDNPGYYLNEEVWLDLNAVYSRWLQIRPKDYSARGWYASDAYRSKKFDIAREQIALLGDHVHYSSFGGRKRFEEIRADVNADKSVNDF
jgi:hypothetical protein